jgi:hypothetical protein
MPKGDQAQARQANAYRAKLMAPPATCEPTPSQAGHIARVLASRNAWASRATPETWDAYTAVLVAARLDGVAWVQVTPGEWQPKALATAKRGKRRKGWSFQKQKEKQDA